MGQILKLCLIISHRRCLSQPIQLLQQKLVLVLVKVGKHHGTKLLPICNSTLPLNYVKSGLCGVLEIESNESRLQQWMNNIHLKEHLTSILLQTRKITIKLSELQFGKRWGSRTRMVLSSTHRKWMRIQSRIHTLNVELWSGS